ncbi:hypothetical protein KPSA3_05738 [Pseudomonas syringae pv. actinidiae]|uniref:Uncharacterized protein n=1 Tax=Pseudomonas syringae pv. actinidiae TaxID=103796 RepID=A0AAN4TNX4_PSESF|nr:hypothetical protein KPSA3_05738 [Pseudomonas syringae pv. actinidiae]
MQVRSIETRVSVSFLIRKIVHSYSRSGNENLIKSLLRHVL